jgi:hypothetical protein
VASKGEAIQNVDDMVCSVHIHLFTVLQSFDLNLTLDVEFLFVLDHLQGDHFSVLVIKRLADLTKGPFSK